MALSNERIRLAEFLAQEDPRAVAGYISKTPKIQSALLDFYGPELDIDALIEGLETAKGRKLDTIRDFIDDFLELRAASLPVDKLPRQVRRMATLDDAKESAGKAKTSFERAMNAVTKVNGLPAAFLHASTLMYHASAASLSAMNLTKRERRLGMLLGAELAAVTTFAPNTEAAIDPQGIQDIINANNRDVIEETFIAPEIPVRQDRFAIEVVPPKLEARLGIPEGLTGERPPRRLLESHFDQAGQLVEADYLLSPYLVKKLEESATAREYMGWILQEAEKNELNPVLFANQMFRESYHFSPKYVLGPDASSAGAMGLGQITPAKGKEYGLEKTEDFFNPQKSISTAARIMQDLTRDYNGDQVLAMVAYNGGKGAVDFVKEELGQNNITSKDWIAFMDKRYEDLGNTSASAWHVETRKYVADITNIGWENAYRSWAVRLQGANSLQYFAQLSRPRAAGVQAFENIMR